MYSVLTNCTYDGMCYDAADADAAREERRPRSFRRGVVRLRALQPVYRDRYAMRGNPETHPKDGPTVFATHSTHKLLAALSQTSYIHIRDGRGAIDHGRFNEAYCSQGEHLAACTRTHSIQRRRRRHDGWPGQAQLTQECIDEAVAAASRSRAAAGVSRRKDWFFAPWNAEEVRDPKTGRSVPFHEAPEELLATDPNCWILHPGDDWHGFEGLPDGWCMLDPIKFGIVCPGMKTDGQLDKAASPPTSSRVSRRHGIVPSRTTDHMVLFLFSVGITKGKWGTLLNTLLDFKADYDARAARRYPRWWRPRRIAMPARASRISATRCGPTCARAGRGTGRRRLTPRCRSRR